MIEKTNRTRIMEEMPAEKAKEKRGRSSLGLLYSLAGVGLAFAGFYLATQFIGVGGEITMWPVVLIGGIVVLGVTLVFYGGNLVSRELTTAFFNDISVTVTKVWRRNGNGGDG